MATGQTILNMMEALAPELQLQSGEADVVKGLLILNAAQDAFESLCAQHPHVFGSGVGNITTSQNVEYTAYPTGLLRLDGLDMLDDDARPEYPLRNPKRRGGHRFNRPFWWDYISSTSMGKPAVYWTNGLRIYWDPIPDDSYRLRYYGFIAAIDITATGTFTYPDAVMLPLASVAVRIIRTGLDDPIADIGQLSKDIIQPVVEMLAGFNRDGGQGYRYEYNHDT